MFKQVLMLNNVLNQVYRSYVSIVNVHAKSLKSVVVKSKDFLDNSDNCVKIVCFDKESKEVQPENVKSLKIKSTNDIFKLNGNDLSELSIQIEIPLESSPEVGIDIDIGTSSHVKIENLQTKSINVELNHGNVDLKNLKSDLIDIETENGNISTKSLLLGKKISLEAKNGDILIEKSQGDNLKLDAKNIEVGSCYNTHNSISSTGNAILKSFHGNSTIKSNGGETFMLSGFSGTLKADLNSKNIDIQLSEVYGKNEISSTNPEAVINLGLSEESLQTTAFKISANCEIKNLISDLLMCQKNEKSYEVRKENPQALNRLKMTVVNGKSLNLSKMSWIDSLQLKSTIKK